MKSYYLHYGFNDIFQRYRNLKRSYIYMIKYLLILINISFIYIYIINIQKDKKFFSVNRIILKFNELFH